jgi:hypothetical protein
LSPTNIFATNKFRAAVGRNQLFQSQKNAVNAKNYSSLRSLRSFAANIFCAEHIRDAISHPSSLIFFIREN